ISVALVLSGAAVGAALLGPWAGVAVAFLLAGSGSLAAVGLLGRPDQHVLEALLLAWLFAGIVRATRPREGAGPPPARAILDLTVALVLAFWTWPGSALLLALAGGAAGALHVLPDAGDRSARRGVAAIAWSAFAAAALLAVSIAWLGPPGALRRFTLAGISAYPVLLCGLVAASAGALFALRARWGESPGRARRVAEALAVAAAAVLAAALLAPTTQAGLVYASRGNAWLRSIHEFRPMFSTRFHPLSRELRILLAAYGLAPLLAALGIAELLHRWRDPASRAVLAAIAAPVLLLLALAVHMWRFGYYAALPLALLSAFGLAALWRLSARLPDGLRGAAVAAAVAAALAPSARALAGAPPPVVDVDALEDVLAPARAPAPALEGAILASWEMGHHVRYLSNRPVLASPFGLDGGPGALEDSCRAFVATEEDALGELLGRRGIRWVLLPPPESAVQNAALYLGSTPGGAAGVAGLLDPGGRLDEERYARVVVTRLYFLAGGGVPGYPAIGSFRLVAEVDPAIAGASSYKLFERVAGARVLVRGASPGATVVARTWVEAAGRTAPWEAETRAGADGTAVLRVPYATGPNGRARVGELSVSDGARVATLSVSEAVVLEGGAVEVRLTPPR
ncbi:MAG TPA: hypothetical protein VF875_00665, partial [Anaeromyxobacter sp.]